MDKKSDALSITLGVEIVVGASVFLSTASWAGSLRFWGGLFGLCSAVSIDLIDFVYLIPLFKECRHAA